MISELTGFRDLDSSPLANGMTSFRGDVFSAIALEFYKYNYPRLGRKGKCKDVILPMRTFNQTRSCDYAIEVAVPKLTLSEEKEKDQIECVPQSYTRYRKC